MGVEQYHGVCRKCGRQTVWQRQAVNHVLHLLISVFLCGLWLPVWAFLILTEGNWRCMWCGGKP